jgi:hypothetical protein
MLQLYLNLLYLLYDGTLSETIKSILESIGA